MFSFLYQAIMKQARIVKDFKFLSDKWPSLQALNLTFRILTEHKPF